MDSLSAVERGQTSKLDDARDAVVNKTIDILGVYKSQVLGLGKGSTSPQLSVPEHLKLLPLLTLALIKHVRRFRCVMMDMGSDIIVYYRMD